MSWLSFLNKRKAKAERNELKKIYFLKEPGSDRYVHPAGKHLFDNSAYALKEGKVGAICVYEEQVKPFIDMFSEEGIRLVSEEIKPQLTTA
ncbi:MAG TPA: hypothetical protein VK589_29990 [Chryseolinea sp.]|nr:hypothetical protein [Chryseolinea sp.]